MRLNWEQSSAPHPQLVEVWWEEHQIPSLEARVWPWSVALSQELALQPHFPDSLGLTSGFPGLFPVLTLIVHVTIRAGLDYTLPCPTFVFQRAQKFPGGCPVLPG